MIPRALNHSFHLHPNSRPSTNSSRPLFFLHPVWAHPGRSNGWLDGSTDDGMNVFNSYIQSTSVKRCVSMHQKNIIPFNKSNASYTLVCIHKYNSIKTLDDVRTSGLGVENIFRYYSHQLSIKCWKIPHHSEAVNNSNLGHMASEMTSFMHPVTRFFKVTILVLRFRVFVPLK